MYMCIFQAAQKEAQQQDGKKQRKKAGKRAAESMDTSKQKSPQLQHQQKVGDKRKRVRKAHVFYDDDGDEEEDVSSTPHKRQKGLL